MLFQTVKFIFSKTMYEKRQAKKITITILYDLFSFLKTFLSCLNLAKQYESMFETLL